jgi:protein involved in polysaccharide export with SLBB domain
VTPIFPISLFGAIASPGVYSAEPTHTVMYMIARAGGLTNRARGDQIRIIRGESIIMFNAKEVLKGGAEASIVLQSGDRIVVPARPAFSLATAFQTLQIVITSTLLIMQLTDR